MPLETRTSEVCRILNGIADLPHARKGKHSLAMGALRATTDAEIDAVIAALKDELQSICTELDTL